MVFRRSVIEPVTQEFIPLNKGCDHDEVWKVKSGIGYKKNWLSSTQLCMNLKQNFEQVVKKTHGKHIQRARSVDVANQEITYQAYRQVVDLTEKTTLLWNVVGGAIPVANVLLKKGARVNAVNIFGFQMETVRHDVQIQKPATSTLDARTLAKKLDMASIAHVLLKLTPTQDSRASMGAKEIDHIGGGVAATNFGAIRVEYPKEESYSRFQCVMFDRQSKRQGLDMTKLSSIHRTLTLFALSSMKEMAEHPEIKVKRKKMEEEDGYSKRKTYGSEMGDSDPSSLRCRHCAGPLTKEMIDVVFTPIKSFVTHWLFQSLVSLEFLLKFVESHYTVALCDLPLETSAWTVGPLIRDSFSMDCSAVGMVYQAHTSGFNSCDAGCSKTGERTYVVTFPDWCKFLSGTLWWAPPVIVFSSACAGLAGGAVPALAQLASSSYHAAVTSPSLSAPPPQKDDISKSRTSSTI
ncbi:hypothetical protein Tco_0196397 [Tanacetum coccineum]